MMVTCDRGDRVTDFPPASAFDMLSFPLDWTGSFIDRWEGSHDGRLCNLSFVSPAPRGRKLARKNKGRKEPLLRTAWRRERLPLFVPSSISSSLLSPSPLPVSPALSLSLCLSFFWYRDEPATARRRRHRRCKRMKNEWREFETNEKTAGSMSVLWRARNR